MSTAPQTVCARCRGVQVLFDAQGDLARATVCECVTRCPTCDGTGRVIRKDESNGALFATTCTCRGLQRRVDLFNRARIPRHFATRGLETFQPYDDASLKAALNRIKAFAEGYPKFGKGLLLWGTTGTGKTHLLCAALRHLTLERGVHARYVEFSFLVSEIKEAFARNISVLAALAPLADVEVLAIDELGKNRGTDFEREVLDELVSRRYNADRTTLFATNFNAAPKKAEAPATGYVNPNPLTGAGQAISDTHLRDRIGDRSYSRIAEMVDVLPVNARDRRLPPM